MQTLQVSEDQEFWPETYRDREIAIYNHRGRWLPYLHHVLQQAVFATAEEAILWLTERIDEGFPSRLN